jgi:hypothetical protein
MWDQPSDFDLIVMDENYTGIPPSGLWHINEKGDGTQNDPMGGVLVPAGHGGTETFTLSLPETVPADGDVRVHAEVHAYRADHDPCNCRIRDNAHWTLKVWQNDQGPTVLTGDLADDDNYVHVRFIHDWSSETPSISLWPGTPHVQ